VFALENTTQKFSFVYFYIPKEYFIRNTGTGSDGRSCHLSHCPTSSRKTTNMNETQ